ncbi:histamine H2 receptor-like [Ptychodera flava]|uniref:histamine H2 receptor-like n=1 Tax=Ptychodera flava TaxID=63121 RepID=UPI003969CE4A
MLHFENSTDERISPDGTGIFYLIFMMILALVVISCNSVVAVAILGFRKLRHNYDYLFVLSLVVSDNLNGLLGIPLEATVSILWQPTPLMCALLRSVTLLSQTSSLANVMLIMLNMYIKIFHPFRYPSLVTNKTLAVSLTFVWSGATSIAIYAAQRWGTQAQVSRAYVCSDIKPSPQVMAFWTVTSFIIPSIFILISNIRIANLVRNQNRRIQAFDSQSSSTGSPAYRSVCSRRYTASTACGGGRVTPGTHRPVRRATPQGTSRTLPREN